MERILDCETVESICQSLSSILELDRNKDKFIFIS